MAKGQQRSNREAKKPKQEKPKQNAAALSTFSNANKGPAPKPAGGKR